MPKSPRASRRTVVATLGVLALIVLPSPAHAHEGNAVIAVETANDRADGTDYTIRVTWTNDGHPAENAAVTASPIDPAGTTATPIAMEARDDDGRYGAFVPMPAPGRWTVRFSIVAPAGTAEVFRDVAAARSTTTDETAPATSAAARKRPAAAGNVLGLVIAIGLMVAVAVVAWLLHRQSKRAKAS